MTFENVKIAFYALEFAKLASFREKLVNFPSEKGRFGFCYGRYTSAVIGYVKELH